MLIHHKTRYIQGFSYGICKCEDTLDIQNSPDKANLNEVTNEEYEAVC